MSEGTILIVLLAVCVVILALQYFGIIPTTAEVQEKRKQLKKEIEQIKRQVNDEHTLTNN